MNKHNCIVCKKEIFEPESKLCSNCMTYEILSADIDEWFTKAKSIFNDEEMNVVKSFDSFLRSNLYENYHKKISSSDKLKVLIKDPTHTLKRAKLEKVDKNSAGQY